MLLKSINLMMSVVNYLIEKLQDALGFLTSCKLGVYNKMLKMNTKASFATKVEIHVLESRLNWLEMEREDIKDRIRKL